VPLSASFKLEASGLLTKVLDLSIPVDSVAVGNGNFPAAAFDLTDGSANEQAQTWVHGLIAGLAAGSTFPIDLSGVTDGPFENDVNFLKVRAILAVIKDPASTKKIRIGPQGQTNAAQLGFGGVGAEAYLEFTRFALLENIYSGWLVTPGTGDLLPIKNSGSVEIDCAFWILGTTS
jgi:hypothetical protein